MYNILSSTHIPTSCELPNDMLEYNLSLNDFDFVLYHLYTKNQVYQDYYSRIRTKFGRLRKMILDNSAYEFSVTGEEFDMDDFMTAISDLKPDYIIAPDAFGDMKKTVENLDEFFELMMLRDPLAIRYSINLPIDKSLMREHIMPVAQGKSSGELIECLYEFADRGYTNVCLPFHNDAYLEEDITVDWSDNMTRKTANGLLDCKYASGRIRFIEDNFKFLYDHFKRIHLLGSHEPYEKGRLSDLIDAVSYHFKQDNEGKDFDICFTMDTGYPVKCAISGIKLGQDKEKPNIIIDDFIDKKFDWDVKMLIKHNVLTFKNDYDDAVLEESETA